MKEIRNRCEKETAALEMDIKQLNDKVNDLRSKIDSKQTELQKKKQEMERQIQNELQIEKQLMDLERHPHYKTPSQIRALKKELEKLGLGIVVKDDPRPQNPQPNEEHNCSICFEKPDECWGCQECDNWVCKRCKDNLETCAHCRQNLNNKPLKMSNHA